MVVMENILVYGVLALGMSVVINLILKKFGISQIIGYILTGTIMMYGFDIEQLASSHALELIGEFGIVFLMFTIGLEISLEKMNSMKGVIFGNGVLQVGLTSIVVFLITHFIFNIDNKSSIIIALAFSLSSTAVVLSHLKQTKDIYKEYGKKSMAILIFQDIAVIPILILIGFLTNEDSNVLDILINTAISALIVMGLLFVIGKRVMTYLLRFSASSGLEELFMGSVLVIVVGASLLAHYMGFTYSLGAFVAGMIIAETKFHHKVEVDIAPFKDLLLGAFFLTVGMKIDLSYLFTHLPLIIGIFVAVLAIKSIIIFIVIRFNSRRRIAFKTALALSQVGEFSFAIFALASSSHLLDDTLVSLLTLIVVFSMVVTPFIISRLDYLTSLLSNTNSYAEVEEIAEVKNHIVVCGYSFLGKYIVNELEKDGVEPVIIDYSMKHIKEGMQENKNIHYGDISKVKIIEAMHLSEASSVIIAIDNHEKKRAICEAILKHTKYVNIVVGVTTKDEKESLKDLPINYIVNGKKEVAKIIVNKSLRCKL